MAQQPSQRVYTTTWPQRHTDTFTAMRAAVDRLDTISPVVLDVGPGAVSRLLYGRLAPGQGADLSWLANRTRATLRNLDSLIRRWPGTTLKSYEPGELLAALPPTATLHVVDISQRVVRAIRDQYPTVHAEVVDLAAAPYAVPVDAVVCLCVLVRAERPHAMFDHIYQSLKPGGVLVIDNRSVRNYAADHHRLEKLDSQVYRRPQ